MQIPMVTTESGLQYKDIKIGEGPSPPIGFQVSSCLRWLQIMLPWFHQGKYLTARWKKANLIFSVWELVRYNNLIVFPIFAPNLSFPKGLTSAPGRPRVAPNSPVIFDVSLEYVPGLDDE
ncbi:hypothetical protein B296_00019302 [Ensete ventricosum]|uniref:Uncharacterized protein n=1 Tax=Ensete ventricosum TaxID=4639 RepID=A0A426YXF1_ENSVE|nr:hypothetical protein B296_00019302 [Ensete ventricosum]